MMRVFPDWVGLDVSISLYNNKASPKSALKFFRTILPLTRWEGGRGEGGKGGEGGRGEGGGGGGGSLVQTLSTRCATRGGGEGGSLVQTLSTRCATMGGGEASSGQSLN